MALPQAPHIHCTHMGFCVLKFDIKRHFLFILYGAPLFVYTLWYVYQQLTVLYFIYTLVYSNFLQIYGIHFIFYPLFSALPAE